MSIYLIVYLLGVCGFAVAFVEHVANVEKQHGSERLSLGFFACAILFGIAAGASWPINVSHWLAKKINEDQ